MQTNVHFQPRRLESPSFSRHAKARAQQRGLSPEAIRLVLAFGERTHDGRGGVRVQMSARAIDRLGRVLGRTQQLDRLSDAYVVISTEAEPTVITTGHRYV